MILKIYEFFIAKVIKRWYTVATKPNLKKVGYFYEDQTTKNRIRTGAKDHRETFIPDKMYKANNHMKR